MRHSFKLGLFFGSIIILLLVAGCVPSEQDGEDSGSAFAGEAVRAAKTSVKQKIVSFMCGNGKVERGEACDDKNKKNADGCSSLCRVESGYSCTNQPSLCCRSGTTACDLTGDGKADRCVSGICCGPGLTGCDTDTDGDTDTCVNIGECRRIEGAFCDFDTQCETGLKCHRYTLPNGRDEKKCDRLVCFDSDSGDYKAVGGYAGLYWSVHGDLDGEETRDHCALIMLDGRVINTLLEEAYCEEGTSGIELKTIDHSCDSSCRNEESTLPVFRGTTTTLTLFKYYHIFLFFNFFDILLGASPQRAG